MKNNNIIYQYSASVGQYPEVKKAENAAQNKITEVQRKTLLEMMADAGVDIDKIIAHYKVESVADMTQAQYGNALNRLKATKEQKK
jgi:hypothetical protein